MKKFRIAGVIFLILAVILGGLAVRQYLEEKIAGKEYDQIRSDVERGTYKLETYVKKVVK